MRLFDYSVTPEKLLTPEIVALISEIHEHRGKQDLFLEADRDELNTLLDAAKIQSTGASNRIEGIYTSDKRLAQIVSEKAEPKNRSEQEIAGYREVLSAVHDNYDYLTLSSDLILQLHKELYAYSPEGSGGNYKTTDNLIAETASDGTTHTRFVPVPAFLTAGASEALCECFGSAWKANRIDKLILTSMFVLDFLCIHPFSDGNGRMSRLLTLLLLYKGGYIVGKYISLEMLIEKTKDSYYRALKASSQGWHEEKNDYIPFVKYYLGIILKAYRDFESRVKLMQDRSLSKPDRIKAVITKKLGKITKKEILEACPDISKITVERTLQSMVKAGELTKVGAGPATAYVKNF